MLDATIIISVKDGERHICQCIDSILAQSLSSFEILIFNDSSQDRTLELLSSYNDPRIKIFCGKDYISNLNLGIEMTQSRYIVRMDADDVMDFDRLKLQVGFMDNNNLVTVCASHFNIFSEEFDVDHLQFNNGKSEYIENPLTNLLLGNFICHPSTILRTSFLVQHKIRYEYYEYAEDYKLWFEIAKNRGVFYVLPQKLLNYRISSNQVSQKHSDKMKATSNLIKAEVIKYLIDTNMGPLKPELQKIADGFESLRSVDLLSFDNIVSVFFAIFTKASQQNKAGTGKLYYW